MQKNKRIPALSALSVLATAAGCTDPIVGDWSLDEMKIGDAVYDFPKVYSYDDGVVITYALDMHVQKDGTGTLVYSYSYTYSYNGQIDTEESRSDSFTLSGTKEKWGNWTFAVDLRDAGDVSLSCIAEKTQMGCTTTVDSEDWEMTFIRMEDTE